MELKTVGIVGHGAFGGLVEVLLERFAPSVGVWVYSSKHARAGFDHTEILERFGKSEEEVRHLLEK
jgi:phosphoglycerate dehydrogenase-like enzyme